MTVRAVMLAPVFLLAACATTVSVPPALEQTKWTLVPASSGPLAAQEASTVTLEFADGKVSGHGGCNKYSGSYSLEGTTLTVGAVGATKMGCAGAANEVERAWFDTLAKPLFAAMVDGRLQLTPDGGETLKLTRR